MEVGQTGDHMEVVQKHAEEVNKQELEVAQTQLQRMAVEVVKVHQKKCNDVWHNHAQVIIYIMCI